MRSLLEKLREWSAMPAKDIYHNTVKAALIKDGWKITHDPFRIRLVRGKNLFVDLGAKRMLAADRDSEKIVVEVKSFTRASDMKDLEDALGQFVLYAQLLRGYADDRTLDFWAMTRFRWKWCSIAIAIS
jgi:hypothetical protein